MRIIGGIKSFSGKKHIQHGHMRPVTDFNEIFYHQIHAIHTHLKLTKGTKGDGEKGGTMALNGGDENKFATLENALQRKIMAAVEALAAAQGDGLGVAISAVARRMQGESEQTVR